MRNNSLSGLDTVRKVKTRPKKFKNKKTQNGGRFLKNFRTKMKPNYRLKIRNKTLSDV